MSVEQPSRQDVWILRALGTVSVLAVASVGPPLLLVLLLLLTGYGLFAWYFFAWTLPLLVWLGLVRSLWITNRSTFGSGSRIRRRLGSVPQRHRVLAAWAILLEACTLAALLADVLRGFGLLQPNLDLPIGAMPVAGMCATAVIAVVTRVAWHRDGGEWRISDDVDVLAEG